MIAWATWSKLDSGGFMPFLKSIAHNKWKLLWYLFKLLCHEMKSSMVEVCICFPSKMCLSKLDKLGPTGGACFPPTRFWTCTCKGWSLDKECLALSFLLIGATMWLNHNKGAPLKLGHLGMVLILGEILRWLTKGGLHTTLPYCPEDIVEHPPWGLPMGPTEN